MLEFWIPFLMRAFLIVAIGIFIIMLCSTFCLYSYSRMLEKEGLGPFQDQSESRL
jgi:hypothetical protein